MGVGARIKLRLEQQQLSQSELARRVGVRQSTINQLVSGESHSSRYLHKIARELRTSPAYLTGEVDDPNLDAPAPRMFTAAEEALVDIYRSLDERSQTALMHVAQTMLTGSLPTAVNGPRTSYRGEGEK